VTQWAESTAHKMALELTGDADTHKIDLVRPGAKIQLDFSNGVKLAYVETPDGGVGEKIAGEVTERISAEDKATKLWDGVNTAKEPESSNSFDEIKDTEDAGTNTPQEVNNSDVKDSNVSTVKELEVVKETAKSVSVDGEKSLANETKVESPDLNKTSDAVNTAEKPFEEFIKDTE